jgi:hypothetical protein
MAQIVNIPDTEDLGGKRREAHITDINIDIVNKRVKVLYFLKYFNEDNSEFILHGFVSVQKDSNASNASRIDPMNGDFLGNDIIIEGSVGEYDFLRSLPPAYLQSMYPDADTMGELIDAMVDIMIKRLDARGGLGQ